MARLQAFSRPGRNRVRRNCHVGPADKAHGERADGAGAAFGATLDGKESILTKSRGWRFEFTKEVTDDRPRFEAFGMTRVDTDEGV